jgi:hypothetical protein
MWHAWKRREKYKVLVVKPEGRRPLGRPRRRLDDGIRTIFGRLAEAGVEWIQLTQDRFR